MKIADELAGFLDPAAIVDTGDERARFGDDLSASALLRRRGGGAPRGPAAVVRPRATAEVAQVLAWAQSTATPVVPYGAGSGVCRGIEPGTGAVVVDMSAMDRVLDVDQKSRLVRAQAGVGGAVLGEELAAAGLTTGHEPQSLHISTVGGWVATRACGQLSARYGGIERILASLEAVLPGGEVVRSKTVPRRAIGPDVASLMIGSEGTLGIVTEATLRVQLLVSDRAHACVTFEHMADGVAACRAIVQSDLRPTLVRLYDPDDAAIFFRRLDEPPSGAVLLLSFDGPDGAARATRAGDLAAGRPAPAELVAHWWAHRNDAVGAYLELMDGSGVLGPHAAVDTMEVSGTWSILRPLYHSMKDALAAEADLVGCHLSHVYPDGGCLYFTLASASSDDEQAGRTLNRWWEVGMPACLGAGGSISHHHGIGRTKARWLPDELGGWWDVLVAVKAALDPAGIMNPGALGL
ncbi:MAG: FAD-binding oxidoreductase [Actinomycetota bacterium]